MSSKSNYHDDWIFYESLHIGNAYHISYKTCLPVAGCVNLEFLDSKLYC